MRDISNIRDLVEEINNLATNKGWRENYAISDQSGAWFTAYIALVHSEVSDALEAYREGVWSDSKIVDMSKYGGSKTDITDRPIGVGPELANAIVRIFDMAGIWHIDIMYEIERVLEYLRKRPYEPCPKIGVS